MEEADDRGGPGILTDCLAGLADTTIWADRGPIDQNPSKIEPQDEKDARRANAAPPCRSCHEVECFGFKAKSEWEQNYLEIAFRSNPFGFPGLRFVVVITYFFVFNFNFEQGRLKCFLSLQKSFC